MALTTIRPGVAFAPAAAASWQRLEAAVGRRVGINRTSDTVPEQMKYYNAYLAYQRYLNGGPWAPVAPLALHPDYSEHVYKSDSNGGIAVDTDERLEAFAEHGWIRNVPSEPWHYEYRPNLDQHRNSSAGTPSTTKGNEEMILHILGKAGKRQQGLWVLVGGRWTQVGVGVAHDPKSLIPKISSEAVVQNLAKLGSGLPA